MKRILIATMFLFASIAGYSQCTPDTSVTAPGVTPAPGAVTCIERGVPYSITMQIRNFGTIAPAPFNIAVDSARIDSITNFPCGITWQADKLFYRANENGCIFVSGTSNDAVGQYPLKIYMTVYATTFLGPQTLSGEISSLIAQSPFPIPGLGDLEYYSRVVDAGDPCPAIDTSATANNLTPCGPVNLTATVTSSTNAVCEGDSVTLSVSAVNRTGTLSYSWNNLDSTATISVSPTTTTLYSVTVTDQNGSATASKAITVNPLPTAAFAASDSGAVVTFTNTSTNGLAYSWEFGDDSVNLSQNPPPHTYADNGTYTVRLIVTNGCGNDTITDDVTITGVFIGKVEHDLIFDVSPNPSNGNVALSFSVDNNSKEYSLKVFDLSGKNVFEQKITAASGTIQRQLDLSALPKGVYTLHLSSGNSVGVKKLQLN